VNQFHYFRSHTPKQAIGAAAERTHSAFLAGGTTLIDLMKLDVERPAELIDINALPLAGIEPIAGGGASPQLRNMATVGGNIMQRTRCYYFRDTQFACNKRIPGSGCPALEGFNRIHAILGTSANCIATNPSDMNVALIALDTAVVTEGPSGERIIPFEQFHLEPGETPERETVLEPGELIIAVEISASPFAKNSLYLKVRDRASYEFALASVALAIEMSDDKIRTARVAFGGVATKPWRAHNVEAILAGETPTDDLFDRAAKAAAEGAMPRRDNAFKVELLQRTVGKALRMLQQRGKMGERT
jgi:xanthine dehydrogenase YagS FAD-binding subunit